MKRWLLQCILGFSTKLIIKNYKPVVVGITGSVGKTSTKEAIAAVLAQKFSVWKTKQNLNTEVGLMIALINGENAKGNVLGWLQNIFRAIELIVFRSRDYPQYLVVEMAADHPGDIRKFLQVVKPQISVVTGIGEIPVHVEYYQDIEAVAQEKQQIIRALAQGGKAILNADDPLVLAMKDQTKETVITFGFSERALVRIIDYACHLKEGVKDGVGISFRLQYQGSSVPIQLFGVLGKPYAYAGAAGAAVGVVCGMNLVEIAKGLESFKPEKGRMNVIKGVKGSIVLDDSYNAAPAAMKSALETLQGIKGKRIIAILGDMLELGQYTEQAHRSIGKAAAEFCDYLFFVGENMKYAFEEAKQSGFDVSRVFHFNDSQSACDNIKSSIQPGDVILVKGSQGIRMEKITEAIMAHPEQASDLLVRQSREWKQKL